MTETGISGVGSSEEVKLDKASVEMIDSAVILGDRGSSGVVVEEVRSSGSGSVCGGGWREGRREGIRKERRQSLQKIQIKNGEYVLKEKGLGEVQVSDFVLLS